MPGKTKPTWSQWERPSRIHHLVFTLVAGLKPMQEYYGHCLPYSHLVFQKDNVTWFFHPTDWPGIGKKLIPIYKKNKKTIWANFEKSASTLAKHSNYRSFYQNYIDFWKVAYIAEPISFYIDTLLKPGEQIGIGQNSFTQDYENAISQPHPDVSKILREFSWIRNSYHDVHQLTKSEVLAEIKQRAGKRPAKPAKIPAPASLDRDLFQIGQDMILLQDRRKKYMMQAASFLHNHLIKIGRKHNLPIDLMDQTVPSEVLSENKLNSLKKDLSLRLQAATVTGDLQSGVKIISGRAILPPGFSLKTTQQIRGSIACKGKATGPAKIVASLADVAKVNHGDVIVSPMTTPDLMPAIRRCVAIVTDFGGITCHAAIVAREFQIPCVVGTDNATKVIHDGDLIEVDAETGVIKILRS